MKLIKENKIRDFNYFKTIEKNISKLIAKGLPLQDVDDIRQEAILVFLKSRSSRISVNLYRYFKDYIPPIKSYRYRF